MEEKGKTLAALEKLLQDRQKSLDSVSYELKLKEGQFEEQARLFEQEQMQYASQTTTEMLERVKHSASLEKSLKERNDHSERQLEEKARDLESKQKLFDSLLLEREEQLHSYKNSIKECEKQFNALQKSVQEQKAHLELLSHGIQMEERDLKKKLDFTLDINTYGRTLQWSIAENSNKVELVGGQLSALFDADEIFKLLGMISQNKQTLQKCQTLWFEDKILDIVRSLIERKQLIQAVRFFCTCKLNDKFDPVPLLIEFVEDAHKCCNDRLHEVKSDVEEDKVVDDRIADLRAVLKCIEDHSVPYPAIGIMKAIQDLEKLKGNGKLRPSLSPTVEKQEQTEGRRRSSSSLYPTPHAYQLRKRT
ncbi:hypothetical protein ACLB2K_064862 [Fragaria x ananassa]